MLAGIFQCAGGNLTVDERLEKLDHALKDRQLDLIVCPELFISGYDVGDTVISLAQPCTGAFGTRIAALAKTHGCAIVYGYPELDDGIRYNSAACVNARGQVIANHRKLLLPPGFESEYFQTGNTLSLFELNGVKCALLICFDVEFPESVRAVAEAGAQVVLVPTALYEDWGFVSHKLVPTRAFENGVWVLYANHAGSENESSYFGGSCIIAPDGSESARAGATETLIAAELEMKKVNAAQARLPFLKKVIELRDKIVG